MIALSQYMKSFLKIFSLKVMKQAALCKHRQAVKTMQFGKKLFKSHLHSS